mgnify:CR=1 FL=1
MTTSANIISADQYKPMMMLLCTTMIPMTGKVNFDGNKQTFAINEIRQH